MIGPRFVIVESPFAGGKVEGPWWLRALDLVTFGEYRRHLRHKAYLRACLRDSIFRGEVPFASHGLYPGALDDTDPFERKLGIDAGFKIGEVLAKAGAHRAFYVDHGWSKGMRLGHEEVLRIGQTWSVRQIGDRA